ncbi:ABC transporter permease [Bradyrhizobium sp. AT1]|jgi:glycerol transport system permease protein|uniref:carbohydrate ABC transporter permease n=1 Tax=Bradyrhizobium sp. AT1 TaxID=574934 RepID=UPI0007936513|nr:sugar ABC transporter permease [Bradyrhizobium sp. AT1]KYG24319.1 ABC transporter permease [Bradyrhizobium sp. AT1]
MQKPVDNRAWFLVAPVFMLVAFNAILPLMTVVNYSFQDTFSNNQFFWNGVQWYVELLDPRSELGERFYESLGRSLAFSAIILAIEVPLGLMVALSMPKRGAALALCLMLMALPLLLPWNVVGIIWQLYARDNIGLFGWTVNAIGIPFNYTNSAVSSWVVIVLMDVWHWTSLIALLCYAGLRAIPEAYYQAAKIDGASRLLVFLRIQMPKLQRVLTIGILLRFMDSFMIYTEPFVVTGGGPGNYTTMLSINLVKIALGQFDLGKAGAMSIVYTLITLSVCWLFYTVITTREGKEGAAS